MTTQSIINSVRRKILEDGEEIISAETMLEYINLAYQDVYKRIYPNSDITSATVTCTAGVCTLPSDFGTLYGDGYDTSNNNFEEVSIADFTRKEFDRAMTVENGTLKVYPTSTPTLAIKYYPKPATLSAIVDPTIDDFFQEAIVYGATYRCQEDLQDEQLATYYRGLFKQELQDRLDAQSAYEELNQRGSVMFQEQRLVSDDSYASF